MERRGSREPAEAPPAREVVEEVEPLKGIGTFKWSQAACATGDAQQLHLFFSEDPVEVAEAKALCRSCVLRVACLRGAVERQEPWGVWGGELFDRGEVIERKRVRGRPRKDEGCRREAERAFRDAVLRDAGLGEVDLEDLESEVA